MATARSLAPLGSCALGRRIPQAARPTLLQLDRRRPPRHHHCLRCAAQQPRQEQQPEAAAAVEEYSDPVAAQRRELGARVVRHLAGEPSRELQDVVRVLPVRIEPPRAWHTLAAGVAAHGPSALRAALAPRRYPIPSFSTLAHCQCQLASSRTGRRFRSRHLNACLAMVFEQLPAAATLAGLPAVELSRWDLHHGHLFFSAETNQLALLLHAKEYPAWRAEHFEVDLGYCQENGRNPLVFDERAMDTRNFLWVDGRLACLDLAAPLLQPLLMPGLELPRTVLESDLGAPLGVDVCYFHELSGRKPAERLFVIE